MKNSTSLLLFATCVTLLFACKKDDPTPMPPVIKFIEGGLSSDGSYAVVKFEFFDNDGDLGLKQEESQGEQQYNLFIDYYEKHPILFKELMDSVSSLSKKENLTPIRPLIK